MRGEEGSSEDGTSSFYREERKTWQAGMGEKNEDLFVMEEGMTLTTAIYWAPVAVFKGYSSCGITGRG